MTRFARRGDKKSTLPGATPWKELKYKRLQEDDDNDPVPTPKLKKTSLKVSSKLKIKKLSKKRLKANIDNSEASDVLLLATDKTKRTVAKENLPKKRKSVSFGENSTLEFTPSKFEMKKKMNSEARRKRRMRQKVTCFKCRQPGHKVDECPHRTTEDDASGICFKCGSAEHTSRDCKVSVVPGDYPYAKCFICKEVGHLARSCPDNPRGLYPNGGGCKLCGSVEHLKANCPKKNKSNSAEDGRGLVLTNSHASVDAEDPIPTSKKTMEKSRTSKKKKIIKF